MGRSNRGSIPRMDIVRFAWLGTVAYPRACALQDVLVEQVHDGASPNTLLLLEHPHVYTRGRLSRDEHMLASLDELKALDIPVYETGRGGQVTYHGPGQLVGYPVINLREWGSGPLKYVRTLEQVILETMADFGILAHTEEGLTGVWTAKGKVAAIGVRISRGVAFHGLAINVNTELSYYRHIVPCGISDRPVTSMAEELGQEADMEAVRYSLVYRFGREMGMRMEDDSTDLLTMAVQFPALPQL